MQLSPVLAQVHSSLLAAAALGDDRTREVAAGLATAVAPAVRLAVLDALYAAADEITTALLDHPGAPVVDVRPDAVGGDEVQVGVRTTAAPSPSGDPRGDDGEASARISLRLSEKLKADVEQAAAKDGVSVNTWLVRAAGAALEPNPLAAFGNLGDLGNPLGRMSGLGRAFGGGGIVGDVLGPDASRTGPGDRQHITGWIDG